MPRPYAGTLLEAKEAGATHVMVVCDTFDYEDYPVLIMPGDSLDAKRREFSGNMQRVMEVIPIQSEQEARLSKVNAELREFQKKYQLVAHPTDKGLQVQFLTTNNGDLVPAKKKVKKSVKRRKA